MAKNQINQKQIKDTSQQYGWGYIQITSSTGFASTTVTFPTPFTTVPKAIVCTPTAYRPTASGAPTLLADFTAAYSGSYGLTLYVRNVTTTGFTLDYGSTSSMGASYVGYSWFAGGGAS